MQPNQPTATPSTPNVNVASQSPSSGTKWLLIIVTVLFLILIVVIYVLVSTLLKNNHVPSSKTVKKISQEATDTLKYDIVSREESDKVGRTVTYKGRIKIDDARRKATEGIGWSRSGSISNPSQSYRNTVTGYFQGIEEIDNSPDYYFIIKVPADENVTKIRILNEPMKQLLATPDQNLTTLLSVEDLNVFVTDTKNVRQGEDNLGNMKFILEADFDKMFQVGDVVTLVFLRQPKVYAPLTDEKGNLVARTVSIRRFNGAKEIENEVYHAYPIKPSE